MPRHKRHRGVPRPHRGRRRGHAVPDGLRPADAKIAIAFGIFGAVVALGTLIALGVVFLL
ncbi:hypothetical protein [Streptomyces sp. NPDC048521]|uniref:hypothetical protein n=1 Tax=Streptomyces sp. NPDC048521 TaxID=3365566 RepID=UPI00371FD225